jgi:hypothetical protein
VLKDREWQLAFVKTLMKFRVTKKADNFLATRGIISLKVEFLFHAEGCIPV